MACGGSIQTQNGFQGEGVFPRCPDCGGYHRDTTPAFQGLVLEACAAVIPSSTRLSREFHADDAAGNWRFDTGTGLFTIEAPGSGRSHAEFHTIGLWDEDSGRFRWSWAWEEGSRPPTIKAAEHARAVGKHYWLRALTAPELYVGETEAWHLTMVAAYLSDLPMVAATPAEVGKIFMALHRPVWEN
ncbi:hypothetical protein HKCCE2091_19525 [Rhodobacterales bacterium HKCCE2091]|nr:hypothetical protein [Rhodobacterales bacterium HKCCE2091]